MPHLQADVNENALLVAMEKQEEATEKYPEKGKKIYKLQFFRGKDVFFFLNFFC